MIINFIVSSLFQEYIFFKISHFYILELFQNHETIRSKKKIPDYVLWNFLKQGIRLSCTFKRQSAVRNEDQH